MIYYIKFGWRIIRKKDSKPMKKITRRWSNHYPIPEFGSYVYYAEDDMYRIWNDIDDIVIDL